MKQEHRLITPDEAHRLLAYKQTNRSLNRTHVRKLVDDIENDRWSSLNPRCTVVVDEVNEEAPRLVDGQHKLHAINIAGKAMKVAFWELEPGEDWREVQRNIDSGGRARSVGDDWRIDEIPHSNRAAAMARALFIWDSGQRWGGSDNSATSAQILEFGTANMEIIQAAIHIMDRAYRNTRANPRMMGLAAILFARIDRAAATNFFGLLSTGAEMETGNPILTLRNRLLADAARQGKTPPWTQLGMIILAWNAWTRGRTLSIIKVPKYINTAGQEVTGFNPADFPVPATPRKLAAAK